MEAGFLPRVFFLSNELATETGEMAQPAFRVD
jgi:hypothetical protein